MTIKDVCSVSLDGFLNNYIDGFFEFGYLMSKEEYAKKKNIKIEELKEYSEEEIKKIYDDYMNTEIPEEIPF